MASAAEPATASAAATSPASRARFCCTAWNLPIRPLEGDALVGVGDAERQDRFERTGGLDAADGRAHQQQGRAIKAARSGRAAQRLDALEGHDIRRVAGEIVAFAQPAILGFDQRDRLLLVAIGEHGDMLRVLRQRHADGTAVQPAVRVDRDPVARTNRGKRHGCRRRRKAAARQQPAGGERFRQRHREREAPGDAENGEALGEAGAGAAQIFRHPGERQPGLAQRTPERLSPGAVLGPVDGLRIGEVGENPCRRLGYDMVAVTRHASCSAPVCTCASA